MRVETIGNATLYLGDCTEILPTLQGVDAIVTDPPYGIGYKHSGMVRGESAAIGITKHANKRGVRPVVGDDEPFAPEHLLGYRRVLMWGADRYASRLPTRGTLLAWDKSCGKGPDDTFIDAEFAWCNWREPRNVFRMLWKGICTENVGEDNGTRWHVTQKPLRLMQWCLQRLGDSPLVCDPYLGSGTTGVAAVTLGRPFVGIEIDPLYFEISCERIAQAQKQQRLFA